MNRGVPPTPPKARTGELTPPGMTAITRSKSACDAASDAFTKTSVPGPAAPPGPEGTLTEGVPARSTGGDGDDIDQRTHVLVVVGGIGTITERVKVQGPDAGRVSTVDIGRSHIPDVHRIASGHVESLERDGEDLGLRLRVSDHCRVDDDIEWDLTPPQRRLDRAVGIRHHADRDTGGGEIS